MKKMLQMELNNRKKSAKREKRRSPPMLTKRRRVSSRSRSHRVQELLKMILQNMIFMQIQTKVKMRAFLTTRLVAIILYISVKP